MNREEQTLELIRQYQNGESDTRNEIIALNMPFIHAMVRKYKPKKVEYEDAWIEGMFAYSQAIKSFRVDRQKFSTYSSICIKNSMLLLKRHYEFEKRKRTLITYDAISLDEPLGDGNITLLDYFPYEDTHPIRFVADDLIEKVLKEFKPKHQGIIKDYFALGNHRYNMTEKYGMAWSSIYWVENRFFRKIKKEAEQRGLRIKEAGQ